MERTDFQKKIKLPTTIILRYRKNYRTQCYGGGTTRRLRGCRRLPLIFTMLRKRWTIEIKITVISLSIEFKDKFDYFIEILKRFERCTTAQYGNQDYSQNYKILLEKISISSHTIFPISKFHNRFYLCGPNTYIWPIHATIFVHSKSADSMELENWFIFIRCWRALTSGFFHMETMNCEGFCVTITR